MITDWLEAYGGRALQWLGSSTLGWTLLLGGEQLLHGVPVDPLGALLHLGSRALVLSALLGVAVGATHAVRLMLARFGPHGGWPMTFVLGGAALGPAWALSEILTEGAWIAEHAYAGAVRAALFVLLLAGLIGLWWFHLLGTVAQAWPRFAASTWQGRALRAAWWACGLGALGGLVVLLPGPLRPYGPLAERLLLPGWLLAATLSFRALASSPRAARALSLSVLAFAGAALALVSLQPSRVATARAHALSSAGFAALTERRTHRGARAAPRGFDFRAARAARCPAARRLPAPPGPADARRNVILLSIDTVRRDAVERRYGTRAVAPSLTAFGQQAIAFDRAVAPAAGTVYSMGSLFTGHSVPQLLWSPTPPESFPVLSRAAFDRQLLVLPDWSGLRARAFSALVTQDTPARFVPRRKDPIKRFLADLEAARAEGGRSLFWLHLVEPHAPYSRRRGFDFGDGEVARYHGEVAYADAQLGRVLARLRELGYFEDSLIVVFSDHGESLGEGGYFGHGVSMAARFTDVPLYVHHPGVIARRSPRAVSLTSIAPTVLHFLDLPVPGTIAACSLLLPEAELARCSAPASTAFGLETRAFDRVLRDPVRTLRDLEQRQAEVVRWRRFAPELALTTGEHRYLFDLGTGHERLYDRARDPGERRDLAADRPELSRVFRERLTRWQRDEAERIVCRLRDSGGARKARDSW